MKIIIGYPPIITAKGLPTLGQNRQFQWFSNPCLIYPVVMSSAATLLQTQGHDIYWIDAVAEGIDRERFFQFIADKKPDLFAFESKTPVIKQNWALANDLKRRFPEIVVVMMGDHVTALPDETMKKTKVDYVLCGGDFDFLLKHLVDYLVGNSQHLPHGFYCRQGDTVMSTGSFCLDGCLDTLPFIDRNLTKWRLYQKEANMPAKPYFYIMSGRDCWWGKCSFCSWQSLYPHFRVRSVENVLDEIGMLVRDYNAREIFDDAGTMAVGDWMDELCSGLEKRGYNKKIDYSCNMRFGVLTRDDFKMMKNAGFRLVKFGLETANQATLDRIGKGVTVDDIISGCQMAQQEGLTVHLTMIVGYPWETKEDATRTFSLAKKLMQKGFADILQATILVPYPGTLLWQEAKEKDWFLFDPAEYERYDMDEPILQTPDSEAEAVAGICGRIYTVYLTPQYLFRRLKGISSWKELIFHIQGARAVWGHLNDFLLRKKFY